VTAPAAQRSLALKLRPAATGRQRQFATIECNRLAANSSRLSIGTRERLRSPTLICSTASAKVEFQSGQVVRPENRNWLVWVGSTRRRENFGVDATLA